MALNYTNTPPEWDNTGTEPTEQMKTSGFTAGYKPPAAYFNWFWHKVGACISEIQTKLSSLHTTAENKVDKTQYASTTQAGIIKLHKRGDGTNISGIIVSDEDGTAYIATNENQGTRRDDAGQIGIVAATEEEIDAGTQSRKPIVPSTLGYAVNSIVGEDITSLTASIGSIQNEIEELRGFTIASEKLVVSSVTVSGTTYTITLTNTAVTEGMCYELDTSQGGSSTNIPVTPGYTYRLQGSMGSHGSRISIGSLDSTQMGNVLNNGYYILVLTVSTTGSGGACAAIDPNAIQAGIQTISGYYSTPQIVGTWIDGTPIWRIAFKRALTQAEINANSVSLNDLISQDTNNCFVINSQACIYLSYPCAVDDIACGQLTSGSFALDTYKPSGVTLAAGNDGIYGFVDYVTTASYVPPPASNTVTLGESQLGETTLG